MFRWKDKKLDKIEGKKIVKNSGTYAVLALAVGAMTFFGVCSPTGNQALGPSGAAATVAGEKISGLEFRRVYQQTYSNYQRQFKDGFDPASIELSKMVLDQLVKQRILYLEASRSGFTVPESAIDKVITDAEGFKENGRFSGKKFSDYLKGQGFTEKSFSQEISRSLVSDRLRQFISDTFPSSEKSAEIEHYLKETKLNVEYLKVNDTHIDVKVNEDELTAYLQGDEKEEPKKYYEKNKKRYQTEKKVRARHILISYKGARNASGKGAKREKEDAMKKATDIANKAKKEPNNFPELAKTLTDETSGKKKGGDLGYFTRSAMVKEFSEIAFNLKPGDISDPVESPFGFHIIKVEGVQPAKNTSFDEAKTEIAKKLIKKKKTPALVKKLADNILQEVKNPSDRLPKLLKNHSLDWQETGEFSLDKHYITGLGSDAKLKNAALSLSNLQKVYPEIVPLNDDFYILRLKKKIVATEKKPSEDDLQKLKEDSSYMDSYRLFTSLSEQLSNEYRENGMVAENIEYRDYDKNMQRQRTR